MHRTTAPPHHLTTSTTHSSAHSSQLTVHNDSTIQQINNSTNQQQVCGIDVSHYQGNINWKKVAKSGNVAFVYIKSTEGATITDNCYDKNVENARKAGLLVGSYHLYSPRSTAYDQMKNIRRKVKKNKQDLKVVLDIEEKHGRKLYMKRVDKLLSLIENEYGSTPIIYTSEHVYYAYFNKPKYKNKYQFFIANYKRKPAVKYALWQYTESGKVPGVPGYVDRIKLSTDCSLNDLKI